MRTATRVLTACAALLVAACGQEGDVAGPALDFAGPAFAHISTSAVCETITFDDFNHGNSITSLPNLFSGAFDLTVTTNNDDPAGEDVAKAYDTDLSGNGDPDLEVSGTCAACGPLDIVAVIPDDPFSGPGAEGDTPDGGIIQLTGFPSASAADGDGQAWIESYDGVDQETTETAIELFIDGVERGATSGQGDGSVETIHADAHSPIDDDVEFHFGGSGAIDNIKVCFLPPPPPPSVCDGLTPGYWKNWSNHYSESEFQQLVDAVNGNDYNIGPDLSIPQITSILGYGGPDPVAKLKKFYYANLLTLALTDLDHLPNPDTAGLDDDCVSSGYPGTTLGEALQDAEDILENDGDGFSRGQINTVKNILDAIANLNN